MLAGQGISKAAGKRAKLLDADEPPGLCQLSHGFERKHLARSWLSKERDSAHEGLPGVTIVEEWLGSIKYAASAQGKLPAVICAAAACSAARRRQEWC
jgi:hypothetical protein